MGPPTIPYKEGAPIPFGYHLETTSNKTLVSVGVGLFGAAYGISLIAGITVLGVGDSSTNDLTPLLIPVAGPFITMGLSDDYTATMALDAITQVSGAVLTTIGLVMSENKIVRNDVHLEASLKPEVFAGPRAVSLRWRF